MEFYSSLETPIFNALSCKNVADNANITDKQQATKHKTRNLENSICNFIAQIWCTNTKVEGDADIIAQSKRNNLKMEGDDPVSLTSFF